MKTLDIISQIRAAQRLALAFETRRTPSDDDLVALGMPVRLKTRFGR